MKSICGSVTRCILIRAAAIPYLTSAPTLFHLSLPPTPRPFWPSPSTSSVLPPRPSLSLLDFICPSPLLFPFFTPYSTSSLQCPSPLAISAVLSPLSLSFLPPLLLHEFVYLPVSTSGEWNICLLITVNHTNDFLGSAVAPLGLILTS